MDSVEVVVNLPFDWIGSVLVPFSAILVSSGIAVWLATRERRAGEQARIRLELGNLMRSLTDLGRAGDAATDDDDEDVEIAFAHVLSDVNVLAIHLPPGDIPFLKFVLGASYEARKNGNRAVAKTGFWLASCLEAWSRRELTSHDFNTALPSVAEEYWDSTPKLSDWTANTSA